MSERVPRATGEVESTKSHESIYDGRRVFGSEHIPPEGYEMDDAEKVGLALKPALDRQSDGTVRYPNGIEKPYYDIARLRLGGTNKFEDLVLATAVMPRADQIKDDGLPGIPFIVRRFPDGEEEHTPVAKLNSEANGVVGRETLERLPQTVSRSHLKISIDRGTGLVGVENLNPTNSTTLLPPAEQIPAAVEEIDEVESNYRAVRERLANRAIDLANYDWK